MNARVGRFVANGRVLEWDRFSEPPIEVPRDGLPRRFRAIDLAAPDRVVPGLKAAACEFWLAHGFYESRGLINTA